MRIRTSVSYTHLDVYKRQEYDEIAHFFTRRFNKNSPVIYGTSLVFGSSIVAASDYLPRLKAMGGLELGPDGRIQLQEEQVIRTLCEYRDAFENTDRETNSWWRKAMEDVYKRQA